MISDVTEWIQRTRKLLFVIEWRTKLDLVAFPRDQRVEHLHVDVDKLSLQHTDCAVEWAIRLLGAHEVFANQFALERSPLWIRNRLEHVVAVQTSHSRAIVVDRDELLHVKGEVHADGEIPSAIAQIHDEIGWYWKRLKTRAFCRENLGMDSKFEFCPDCLL